MKYTPIPHTESIRQRVTLLVVESINDIDINRIDVFVGKLTDKLVEIVADEIRYGRN